MPVFDAEELLHLGVNALERGDAEGALHYFKECLELDADNARACHLLAATYAELHLYDRARPLFRRAQELAPGEHTAAFQLGLLELLGGDTDAAVAAWQPIDALDADHYLHLFKTALLALAAGETDRGVALIDAGIRGNPFNPALNANLQTLRDLAAAPAASQGAGQRAAPALDHVLSRYQDQHLG